MLLITDTYEKIIICNNILCYNLIKNDEESSHEYYKTINELINNKEYSPWFRIRLYNNFYMYASKFNLSLKDDILIKVKAIKNIEHDYYLKNYVNQICDSILNNAKVPSDNPLFNMLKSGYILGPLSYWGFIFKIDDIDLMNY